MKDYIYNWITNDLGINIPKELLEPYSIELMICYHEMDKFIPESPTFGCWVFLRDSGLLKIMERNNLDKPIPLSHDIDEFWNGRLNKAIELKNLLTEHGHISHF